ncbi:ABC transporter ATP-binding protein [Sphaerisporangium krabiense]|uniref:Peptide/nickel transport system ATP-binding protein n=1 Tax=Sphaerisporangium krabiense TaxID=763782 RepID=A0A7W8Z9W9_9ACTN|nr:ABC transporter ATP-binding protein [Sphaerisporangium krabiense]MBB5629773.1 peptide/nickel transport system ATP-binding protein [Sphaerisporangium krabiense]GII63872.1 ABC transporter ATP-binding protein [Sphaerisporangium krabiense]
MNTTSLTAAPRAGSANDRPLLVVDDLRTVIHTPRGAMNAVDGVSLTLRGGETLGIVGESGSGKSVLGRTIMGLYRTGPEMTVSGRVGFGDHDVHALAPQALRGLWGADIAMVFQDPMTALNPVRKIASHLVESLRKHRGLSRADAMARAAELLNLVGIPEPKRRLGQYPHELSGGMRQRVVIAMALANDPKLLIADEPTTALDVTVQKQILDLLDRLQSEMGMAIILISHNLGVVAGRADRVAVMYAGRLVETGSSGELFGRPRHPYTEALLSSIPRLEDLPHMRLRAIAGSPPDMTAPPPGCRFAPRCRYAAQDCREEAPPMTPDGGAGTPHAFACHHPVSTGGK